MCILAAGFLANGFKRRRIAAAFENFDEKDESFKGILVSYHYDSGDDEEDDNDGHTEERVKSLLKKKKK